MQTSAIPSDALALDLACECLYRFLAAALSDPLTECYKLVLDPQSQRLAGEAASLLREEGCQQPVALGFGELPAAELDLGPALCHLLRSAEDLRGEYERTFGLVLARECPPYETEYHASAETFFRSQQLADIAGFYRAFGLDTPHTVPERPDHLALELEFMAFLLLKKRCALESGADEQASICEEAQRSFFRDHLAWWVPSFATGLRRKAEGGFYAAVGQVLSAFVPLERGRFNVPAPRLALQPALIERPEEQSSCAGCVGHG